MENMNGITPQEHCALNTSRVDPDLSFCNEDGTVKSQFIDLPIISIRVGENQYMPIEPWMLLSLFALIAAILIFGVILLFFKRKNRNLSISKHKKQKSNSI